ncbi:MAG: Fe-S cluster assembly protein SufD [FCB group bacterium]|jgi:Fe-S cluster assembly protein SufD
MPDNFKNKVLDSYKSFIDLTQNQSENFLKIRKDAIEKFESMEFPTIKNEEWKYDNLSFINKHDFNIISIADGEQISQEMIAPYSFQNLDTHFLVFINGFYSPRLSKIQSKKKSIYIGNLADAINKYPEEIKEHFSKYSKSESDIFIAMNTALAQDGAFIYIPDGISIEHPIHLLYLTDSRKNAIYTNPRNLIIAGECSNVKIIESSYTIGSMPAFTNLVSEMVLDFSSNVEYYKIQNNGDNSFYIGTSQTIQNKASSYNSTTVSLKGNFIRNNLNTLLNAESCEANFNGFYYLDGNNFVDNHTLVDHANPNCVSNENYKGIMDDKSIAVFNGKVIVRPDAQKTNALQTNRNILLTDEAKINSKPQLEIFADDVKCSHGATCGYLDKEAMFYLRARGIGEEMAKSLLLNAFAGEIIEKINISELRDEIKRQIAQRLIVDDIYFCDVLEQIVE